MGISFARIIQAVVLAAAVLGLLLSTPSLEARPKPKHKKMKIVFDGSEPAAPQGELGDEVVQPRMSSRQVNDPRQVVYLRGSNVDEAKLNARISKKAKHIDHRDGPDLIAGPTDEIGESRAHAASRTTIGSGLADESALGSFKPASVHASKPPPRIAARPAPVEDSLTDSIILDQPPTRAVKVAAVPPARPVAAQAPAAPQRAAVRMNFAEPQRSRSRIYLHDPQVPPPQFSQPAARQSRANTTNSLAANLRNSNEPSEFTFNVAFENTTTAGRKYELEIPGGRNFMMKNELFLGTKHSSGWGGKISVDYLTTSNDDATKNIAEMADPSLIIEHPEIYKTRDLDLTGFARYYTPLAKLSRDKGLQHFAYYLVADLKLSDGYALNNTFVARYFLQQQYADADAFSLIEDHTEFGKPLNDWLRLGVGQRTQIESHQAVMPGTSVELYPFADLLAISNTVLQARWYLPLVAHGTVNGAPGSPSGPVESGFSNSQFELFARIAF